MFFFHRDPDRSPQGEGMLSPADGLVMEASEGKVAIFMSVYDVHVNRAPLDGIVRKVEHHSGGHLPAFLGSSVKNQRNLIEVETPEGEFELFQIAGVVVREVVSYVRPGDYVKRGERIGMIRFGSRVEVTIPQGYSLTVKKGDRVRAGETVIAVKDHEYISGFEAT
jgi:phosphatidylserine decarboxylase